jgi:hypothetical protein
LNKAGVLYKSRLIVDILRVVLETGMRMAQLEKKAKAAAVLKKQNKLIKRNSEA